MGISLFDRGCVNIVLHFDVPFSDFLPITSKLDCWFEGFKTNGLNSLRDVINSSQAVRNFNALESSNPLFLDGVFTVAV